MLAARFAVSVRVPLTASVVRRITARSHPVLMSSAVPQSHKRSMVRIGTHSGTFHCDEALGCFLLKQTPEFKGADIVRSRDPKVLQDLDVVIDVGGTYDAGDPQMYCLCMLVTN